MKLKPRSAAIYALLLTIAAGVDSGAAQDKPVKQVLHERHENFHVMEEAYEDILKEIRKRSPKWDQIEADAARIRTLARDMAQWFPPGSGPEAGKTKAKAEIWSQPADFQALQERFAAEVHKIGEAAARADQAEMAMHMDAMGKACGACHDKFRKQTKLLSIFGG
jgi:cytochrome c556